MIWCGSILLFCCDGRREVDPDHRYVLVEHASQDEAHRHMRRKTPSLQRFSSYSGSTRGKSVG
jgi:hypothetical protein